MPDLGSHIIGLLSGAPKTQELVARALNREAHPSGGGHKVLTIRSASGRHFEWHPMTQKVYYIKGGVGEVIAFDILTHGDAMNAVNIWNRGYAEGQRPGTPKIHLQL